jgi:dolichyl-phosphate beta-glucosyltransferase
MTSSHDINLSLIIPCYKEQGHLERNVLKLVRYLTVWRFNFELIFVDDASPDGTRAELAQTAATLETMQIKHQVVLQERNRGRGFAVRTGIPLAMGRIIGYLDIDLENIIDSLPMIYLQLSDNEADMVVGRRVTYESSFLRTCLSKGYRVLRKQLLDLPFQDTEAGYKFFSRACALKLVEHTTEDGWFWDTEVIWWAVHLGFRVKDHPIVFVRDPSKKSTVKPFADSWDYLRTLLRFRQKARSLLK